LGKRILVIDDEEMILTTIKLTLEDLGHTVFTTSDTDKGIEAALTGDYDLVITDIRMPERTGAEIVEAVLEKKPGVRILVMTAYPGDPLAEKAMNAGAVGLLKKPFEAHKVLDFIKNPAD